MSAVAKSDFVELRKELRHRTLLATSSEQGRGGVTEEIDDLLSALPKPPMGDLFDYLIDEDAVDAFAEYAASKHGLSSLALSDLRDLMHRAALLYVQWNSIQYRIGSQHADGTERRKGYPWRGPLAQLYRGFLKNRSERRRLQKRVQALLLAQPAPHRPTARADRGFISIMWRIWTEHGPYDGSRGIAYDGTAERETPGRFQAFVDDFIAVIDPSRSKMPNRTLYNHLPAPVKNADPRNR